MVCVCRRADVRRAPGVAGEREGSVRARRLSRQDLSLLKRDATPIALPRAARIQAYTSCPHGTCRCALRNTTVCTGASHKDAVVARETSMSSQSRHDALRSSRLAALTGSVLALLSGGIARADSPAMSTCPTMFFLTGNLAVNSNFEAPAPGIPVGQTTCWIPGLPAQSAAAGWTMHSSNDQDRVCSQLLPSTAPEPNGTLMLKFIAGGNEGGVFQPVTGNI